jgi:hypothetical protein
MNSEITTSRRHIKILLLAVTFILAVGAGWVALSLLHKSSKNTQFSSDTTAEARLYGALANAAKQQKIRVSMYRETFATKADADTRKHVGTVASSVGELDTDKGFRSVYAHNLLQSDGSFSVGRCIDNTTYNDYYKVPARPTTRAKTLQEAATRLKLMPQGNLFKVTQSLTYISCPHIGLLAASPPVAVTRLSDGVFPVTFSDQQATNWRQKLFTAKLFTVKDEGSVERDDRKLRKISFAPRDNTTNQKLYDLFYETGEIAKIKSEQPKAEVDYEFQSINPNNTGGVGGYYLIDEQTNLPVYSELYSTNQDKSIAKSRSAADRNIARTKQVYAYPAGLTLDINTPLEFLN